MAHEVTAQSMIIGATAIDTSEIVTALQTMGMEDDTAVEYVNVFYEPDGESDDHASQSELLIEFAGRLCYKSFAPGMNANVTKVREGNANYLGNVIKQGHGSVFEHSSVSVLFTDVTRVFTHEAVRHRPGFAYSQESMRYVRMDDLGYRYPSPFRNDRFLYRLFEARKAMPGSEELTFPAFKAHVDKIMSFAFQSTYEFCEGQVKILNDLLAVDHLGFEDKKVITSALRRLIPDGVATNILITGNHRAWRHVFAMRTSTGAEEEIREVMGSVAVKFKESFPNIYQDMTLNEDGAWVFGSPKI